MIAILHADENWGIGKNNGLMFSLPEDMKFFKATTSGKVACMGYNTLLSLPGSKPLKNRVNIVLCPEGVQVEGCICVHDLKQLSSALKQFESEDVFIIGGAMFYKTMLPYCHKALVTKVLADGGADVFFPNLDELDNWELTSATQPVNDNGYEIIFTVYVNKKVCEF